MVNDTTTAVGYIMMVGKDTTLADLKGLDEGVFYQLYKGNMWKDLNGLTLHTVYQVVTQNLMQNAMKDSIGREEATYPNVLTNEWYEDPENGLRVNDHGKGTGSTFEVEVTIESVMEDEGSSRYIELIKHMVKTVVEDAYNLFGKNSVMLDVTSDDKGIVDEVATILTGVFTDSSDLEQAGVLTEDDVRYITYEIVEFIKYLENVNKWWLSKYAYMLRLRLGVN